MPGKLSQSGAHAFLRQLLVLPGEAWLQVDLELAGMRTDRVDAGLGTTRMLGHAAHTWHGSKGVGYQLSDAQQFIQRSTGNRGDVQDQMAFPQIGQKGAAEERQHPRSSHR